MPRIGQLARKDVVRARLSDPVGEIAEHARADGWDTAMVVNDKGIVLGRLFKEQLEEDPAASAGEVMQPGPSTFRPDVDVVYMTKFMAENELETAPVTTSDGVLIGVALKEDLDQVRDELPVDEAEDT
ncbi:MAG: hypothetical protein M3124_05425 [Actinomycetota bacterium]|nr:hypothetical protein [Actinomycetota bacterium]